MDNKTDKTIQKLEKKIKQLETTLRIITRHSGKTEDRMRRQFEIVCETIPIPMVISNKKGEILYTNTTARTVFGYSEEGFLGINASELYHHSGDRKRFLALLKTRGEVESFHTELETSDGSIFPAALFSQRIDFNGQDGILTIVHDLTRLMALEKKLRQKQKIEAIGTLAGGIAHDFNNILSGIFGYSQLAKAHINNPDQALRDIGRIMKGAQKAADLVQQVLAFSRKTKPQKQPLRVYIIVKEALKLLRSTIPTTITIKQNIASTAMVRTDPTQIHQVIMNLCTNAYHAMLETGGVLDISLKEARLNDASGLVDADFPPGDYVSLAVGDTGAGMPPEMLKRIFDPYFTTKDVGKGTGLGLAVVHGIVQDHRGKITVSSEPGRGTTFTVFLPVTQDRPEAPGEKAKPQAARMGSERIMVVDDEESILDVTREMMKDLGYRVTVFTTGTAALEAFKKDPHRTDLVITDMAMPGMNGFELSQALIKIRPDLPVILCTGHSELINREKAMAAGIADYLEKPVMSETLTRAVETVFQK